MYLSHYGFREAPFSVTPNPKILYSNATYEEAFANLRYGIEGRKGFIVLTGEVGTGKTTLLRRLMGELHPNNPFVFLFNTRLGFDEILTFVCDELGISPVPKLRVEKIQALNEFFLRQVRTGRTTALLVDEAQNLQDDALEELRLLSNLETNDEKLLQIVLVGQPELDVKLARQELRQLRQRIAVRCHLDKLKMSEVGPFIEARLKAVGYSGPKLFAPDAVQAIARYSRGVPRLVNILCDNALLIGYATSKRTIGEAIVTEAAGDLELVPATSAGGVTPVGLDHALRDMAEEIRARSEARHHVLTRDDLVAAPPSAAAVAAEAARRARRAPVTMSNMRQAAAVFLLVAAAAASALAARRHIDPASEAVTPTFSASIEEVEALRASREAATEPAKSEAVAARRETRPEVAPEGARLDASAAAILAEEAPVEPTPKAVDVEAVAAPPKPRRDRAAIGGAAREERRSRPKRRAKRAPKESREKADLVVWTDTDELSAAIRRRNAAEAMPRRDGDWRCDAAGTTPVRSASTKFSNPVSPTGEIGW